MRFEVSRVLDAIEQHLTTDPTLAQAVVDIAEIARFTRLDGGRGINLIRIGMVVDALGRYLRDGGVFLYPVAPRQLLSDAELTSKERMVLGRWTDEGLIEATADAGARVPEVAELTGLPVISVHGHAALAAEYPFLARTPVRVLTVSPRGGGALLTDGDGGTGGVVLRRDEPEGAGRIGTGPNWKAVGKATPKGKVAPPADDPTPDGAGDGTAAGKESGEETGTAAGKGPARVPIWPDPSRVYVVPLPEPPTIRGQPSAAGASLLARNWRCTGFGCPSFGIERKVGQPVPHLRKGVPVCPRHDERLTDVGPRPPEIAVALMVDGLRRQRFVVTALRPVRVGRAPGNRSDVPVEMWLHDDAAAWVSPDHLELAVENGRLVLTDLSTNGSLVWTRPGERARPETLRLYEGKSHPLGEWDTVELYTGIELGYAERRPKGVNASPEEPASVLVDAPTLVLRLPDRRGSI